MAKSDKLQKEISTKGNSSDSLLVIYILDILKKYSSPENPLSSQDVMEHLRNDYSIGKEDNSEALKKKIRRHLDTLHESYLNSCIRKEEGGTRKGHKWYYDVTKDNSANEECVVYETLSEAEIELLVDLVSATKILNSEGTRGMIDKLLKKTSLSEAERERRLGKIEREAWLKTPNSDLVEKKDFIEDCFYNECLIFDYEDEEGITAIPLGWVYENGVCLLNAKVHEEERTFELDKIRNYTSDVDGYEDVDDFRRYDEETDSDKTALDSLFVNIPTIKQAIAEKKRLHFLYRSYVVDKDRIVSEDRGKSVLPHSLVFNDGKYYLIGIDDENPASDKIAYFRVDLMFELYCEEAEIKLSDWGKHVLETIDRAREVEKHPLMMAGKAVPVTFKVMESALDRVIDAFGKKADEFEVTGETRRVFTGQVKDNIIGNNSAAESQSERVVRVKVRTTIEEAFRWSLANADVVELISPYELRYKLRRIAAPLQRSYVKTIDDQVRENIDRICESGEFNLVRYPEELPIYNDGTFFSTPFHIGEELAYESYKVLRNEGKLGVVNNITIWHNNADKSDYLGDFENASYLDIANSESKAPEWISKLTELTGIHISSTNINNVDWLKNKKNLQVVVLKQSPVSDLSVIKDNEYITAIELVDTEVDDISFIENYQCLSHLTLLGCPVKDYSPLLRIHPLMPLMYLEIDGSAVESLGIENIKKHHPDAEIIIKQKI